MSAVPHIRDERAGDEPSIHILTRKAFRPIVYASGTEQHIVDALRAGGLLTVSLVAELSGSVVGHVGFSPVSVSWSGTGWYGLGPVAVLPPHQRQGIGSALIQAGLSRLRAMGATACVLAGDPGYYRRFGFVHDPRLVLDQVPAAASLFIRFCDSQETGVIKFNEIFFRSYSNLA
jgi:putative acetyltransferase